MGFVRAGLLRDFLNLFPHRPVQADAQLVRYRDAFLWQLAALSRRWTAFALRSRVDNKCIETKTLIRLCEKSHKDVSSVCVVLRNVLHSNDLRRLTS